MNENRRVDLGVAIAALAIALATLLAKAWGSPLPKAVSVVVWFAIPFLGALLLARRNVLDLLGLTRFSARGVAVAGIGSLAMLGGIALTAEAGPTFELASFWEGALRPAFAEELLFRGLVFSVLYWRLRWSFVAAMLSTGLVFGLFHVPGAVAAGEIGQAWGTVAVTAAGGCWYAWLYVRWDRSLWVPITAHLAMNAWWTLYSAGPTAVGGGSGATGGRIAAVVLITMATLHWTDDPPEDPSKSSSAESPAD